MQPATPPNERALTRRAHRNDLLVDPQLSCQLQDRSFGGNEAVRSALDEITIVDSRIHDPTEPVRLLDEDNVSSKLANAIRSCHAGDAAADHDDVGDQGQATPSTTSASAEIRPGCSLRQRQRWNSIPRVAA